MMTRISTKLGVLLLSLFLGAAFSGCSDDEPGGKNDPNKEADATSSQDTSNTGKDSQTEDKDAGTEDAADDTTPPDAEQNPADVSSADADADASDNTDADEADTITPPETGHTGCTYPPEDGADCPAEAFGDHGPASFINQFAIESTGTCCVDFTGNGQVDSAVGNLTATLEYIIGLPFNSVIEAQIQNDRMTFLLEYTYFSDPVNDPALDLNLLFGMDSDADFAPNLTGQGDFLIDPRSLDIHGEPKSTFSHVSVRNGRLVAANGSAALMLPLDANASIMTQVQVQKLRIEANVDQTADLHAGGRVALTSGELSGAVSLEEFFNALNTMASPCACLGSQPLFVEEDAGQWSCAQAAWPNSCASDPDSLCRSLGNQSTCGLISSAVSGSADIELNNSGTPDALSLGATFNAVGASIVGVAP